MVHHLWIIFYQQVYMSGDEIFLRAFLTLLFFVGLPLATLIFTNTGAVPSDGE